MRLTLFLLVAMAGLLAAASARADDRQVCSEAYTSAQALRDEHRLLEARSKLRVCAGASCAGFIVKDCVTWLGEVEASIPSVVLSATSGGANVDARVTESGAMVAASLDGRAVEMDPGRHVLHFAAADGRAVDATFIVREGLKNQELSATLPTLSAAPAAPEPPRGATPGPAAGDPRAVPDTVSQPAKAPEHPGSPLRIAGATLLVAGGVAIVVGGVFGVDAVAKKSDANCPNNVCPFGDDGAASSLRDAKSAGNLSTVFFAAGAIAAAGGLVLYLVAPNDARPQVGVDGSGVFVRGAW